MTMRMRQERIAAGWTQVQAADRVGITKAAYSNIETGKRKPSYDVLVKLENLFGKSHRELFAPAPGEIHGTMASISQKKGI